MRKVTTFPNIPEQASLKLHIRFSPGWHLECQKPREPHFATNKTRAQQRLLHQLRTDEKSIKCARQTESCVLGLPLPSVSSLGVGPPRPVAAPVAVYCVVVDTDVPPAHPQRANLDDEECFSFFCFTEDCELPIACGRTENGVPMYR